MKKRSLFAAVAMLIVSALVLTSATYAWFAQSDSAEVDEIKASVEGVAGSLLIAATDDFGNAANTNLKTKLTSSDWTNLSDTLQPVSFRFGTAASPTPNSAPDIYKVAYDGANFTGDTVASTDYVRYAFKVQYSASDVTTKKVVMTTDISSITSSFGYVLVRVKPYNASTYTNYIFSATDGDGYTPVQSINGVVKDNHSGSGTAGIVDGTSTDTILSGTGQVLGAPVVGDNSDTAGIDLIAAGQAANTNLEANVQVYIWAEGNDTNCTGSASSADVGVAFNFALEDPTP